VTLTCDRSYIINNDIQFIPRQRIHIIIIKIIIKDVSVLLYFNKHVSTKIRAEKKNYKNHLQSFSLFNLYVYEFRTLIVINKSIYEYLLVSLNCTSTSIGKHIEQYMKNVCVCHKFSVKKTSLC
jgi:hypothetical protein